MGLSISLELKDRKALVVGGGKTAYRKAEKLTRHGAGVTVVSPYICEDLIKLNCIVKQRKYTPGDEDGFFVVFCATDDSELNEYIYKTCDDKGILCQSVNSLSHFSLNAQIDVSGISISVSTNGNDPGYARKLCKSLAAQIDVKTMEHYNAHKALRKAVVDGDINIKDKQKILKQALNMTTEEINQMLKRGRQ